MTFRRAWLASLVSLSLVLGCQDGHAPVEPAGSSDLQSASAALADRYIVVFRDGVRDVPGLARQLTRAHRGNLRSVYRFALEGFLAELPPAAAAALAHNPNVAFVEEDQLAYAFGTPTGVDRIFAAANSEIGIDGIDDLRVDVDVAVLDTGIAAHPDLDIVARTDCSSILVAFGWPCSDGAGTDGNGHGTHVAGTIGAIDDGVGVVGVAPGARLHSIKVLGDDGSGSIGSIVAGIDWITARAGTIEVANMSLGCECSSQAMDDAIANSVAAGITYAVAAGNSDADAATHSPANHPDVITASALADFDGVPGGLGSPTCRSDEDDTLANFSNWGNEIEIAAPGVCIESTWLNGGFATISGTSMASPHVAGAAALLASMDGATPASIRSTLIANGNFDWTDDSGDGIQEPLLDVGNGSVFDPVLVAGGGGGDGGDGGDDGPGTPPNVGISNPAEGEVRSGVDEIRVAATDLEDAFGSLDIDVRVNEGSWEQTTFSADFYRLAWDTTLHPDGETLVEARGTDSDGNVTNDAVTAFIDNSGSEVDEPPSAAITNPSDGASVTGVVTIQVDASDTEDAAGSLTVEVRVGSGGAWQSAAWNSTTSRYELDWDTGGVADGTAVDLDARATDSAANTTNAATVNVTVDHPDAGGAITKIVIRVERKGPNYQAAAEVHAEKGTAVTGDFTLDGAPLNRDSDSVGGRGFTVLQSDKVQGLSGSDTFALEIVTPSAGVTGCSTSVSQGVNTCQ